MTKFEEHKSLIEEELKRKGYKPRTIGSYLYWMKRLWDSYPKTNPDEFTFEQIKEFIDIKIKREKLKANTVHQAAHTFTTVFRSIYSKDFDFDTINLPKRTFSEIDVLTEDEIVRLLNNTEDPYRLIFATMYSAGLTLQELQDLRVADINFPKRQISIQQTQGKSPRKAALAVYLEEKLKDYLRERKPQKWLFEGKKPGEQISDSAVQRNFQKAIFKAEIKKDLKPKNLKYSYVKHLYNDGIPLKSILESLGMAAGYNFRTYAFYSKIVYESVEVDYSPLDRIVSGKDVELDTRSIERMLISVRDEDEREYLLEALNCIKANVYRAAVIFAWTAAMINIHNRFMKHGESSVNTALQKHYPKAPRVKNVDDFTEIKDSVVLEASETLGVFEKNQKNTLVECLGLRNKCGHPGKYAPQPIKVAAFLEDLVQIVFN